MDTAVQDFLEAIPSPTRRRDAFALVELMGRATGEEPHLAGTIVGFGTYHYRYASGREGDAVAAGFAPRKAATTIYLLDGVAAHAELLERLGPHTTGVGCLYVKDLEAVDRSVLEEVVRRSYAALTAGTFTNRAADRGRSGHESRSTGRRTVPSVAVMTHIDSITLEVADASAAADFYKSAFGLDPELVRLRESDAPASGFRGFTLSLIVTQPANADALIAAALEHGATSVRPAAKSLWGYGGAVQAPDGTLWNIATQSKKNTAPAAAEFTEMVLLLGVDDIGASKRFYTDRGFEVSKSFGRMYAEFASPEGAIKFGLNRRRALAKSVGVAPDGSGAHRIAVASAAGAFTDPDGFVWEASGGTR